MKHIILYFTSFSLTIILLISCTTNAEKASLPKEYTMSKTELLDKVKGGWAGQVIGCTYGGPTEFKYLGTMIQDYIPIEWNDSLVTWYYDNFPGLYDDVYMDLTFVDVIERLGVEAPVDSFASAYANADYQLWAANQMGRYNILQGVKPPFSGHWLNNPHANDIDFQIESDFIGLMYPGMPTSASALADKVGHIMNYGDGWYGGVFASTMYSLAFITDDVPLIVNEALKAIPKESTFHQCIADVIKWHKMYPNDWKQTWFECQKRWSEDVGSPDGIFKPYNIDAKINSAYVTIGLLYGEGDFFKSIDISTRCGQDSDCNPATVAGVLGTAFGYDNIPEKWKTPLVPVADRNFDFTEMSLNDSYEVGFKHALAMIEKEGGKVTDDDVTIKVQPITTVALEQGFEGHYPIKIETINKKIIHLEEFEFEGIGVVFKGSVGSNIEDYAAEVEVYIDGELVEEINLPKSFTKRRPQLFHKYQLSNKAHKVAFKWLNPDQNSTVYFQEAIIYSDKPHAVNY